MTLLHARVFTGFQQIDETDDIDARIKGRISDGTADIHLRRMVVQNIRFDLCNQLGRLWDRRYRKYKFWRWDLDFDFVRWTGHQ